MVTEQDKSNAEVMKRFYEAVFSGNWDGVAKTVSKDLIVYEADGLPYHGEYRGMAGLQEVFGKVVGYWDDLNIDIKGVTCGDGYVVGVLQFSGTSKSTGKKISMPIAEISEFKNDVIATIKPVYWDTKAIAVAVA